MIKTAAWSTKLPPDHMRIGISRGTPRWQSGGYKLYRRLAPGPWFDSCETHDEFCERYQREMLNQLDPRKVAAELQEMAGDRIPVLLCFEKVGGPVWCHRSLAAAWLAEELGVPVPEFGHEDLPQELHPLLPPR
jgi:hypothetical protein